MKKALALFYRTAAFTGLWLVPLVWLLLPKMFHEISGRHLLLISLGLAGWTSFNNLWAVTCEGKRIDELGIGSGLVPDTGLKKESPEKRMARYPKVPPWLLSKKPEGIIVGVHKNRYVRIPKDEVFHCCIIGGSGSGKTSTVLLGTLLANFAAGRHDFQVFAIDIKGELHQKSTYAYDESVLVVNPSDRSTAGWDAYYRLNDGPSEDLLIEAMEEIAQALIISTNPKDAFFVENARSMFTGLLIYYYKQGEGFIDSVNRILEADVSALIAEAIKDSDPSDLHYKYLAKFSGKDAESVQDCMVEMTTALSVFSKSDIKFCFRDNYRKASPLSFQDGKSVFLAIPEHLLESYKAVMRLVTVQTLKAMERRPEQEAKPMLLLIDEFARLGRIEGIFNALATLRSKKVTILLAFQSMAQMEVVYSKEEARVLTDNCRAKVICEASDPETARMATAWAGKFREKKRSLSTGKGRSSTYSYEDRDIIDTSDLITLTKKEEVVLVVSGVGYLRPKKCYYFKDPTLKALADKVREYNKHFER